MFLKHREEAVIKGIIQQEKYFAAVLGHLSAVSARLKIKTATITGQFRIVFELISGREITLCHLF